MLMRGGRTSDVNVAMSQQPGINRMPTRNQQGSSRDKRTSTTTLQGSSVRRHPPLPSNSFIRGGTRHNSMGVSIGEGYGGPDLPPEIWSRGLRGPVYVRRTVRRPCQTYIGVHFLFAKNGSKHKTHICFCSITIFVEFYYHMW